jgi:MFS family permease
MPGRWSVLALLFAVRATMAFQYQSVAALAPLITRDLSVSLADIGLLFGLYLAPGIAIAFPGGAIGRWVGDKPVVLFGLAMMIGGGVLMALVPTWEAQIAGRLLAGTGGVFLNVLMSKMVTDWFAGREIATAMAVFVNSWPAGIAVALLVLPAIGAAHGVSAAFLFSAALVAVGALGLAALYRSPPPMAGDIAPSTAMGRAPLIAVTVAGILWGLYNVGFAMVFAFGPSLLAERGWSVAGAGSAVSIVMWLAMLSVPLGGLLADRIKRHGTFIIAGCIASAGLLLLTTREESVLAVFVALGLVSGLPAGPIMSLPSRVLAPRARAIGMGAFFTVFYAGMVAGPAVGGWAATRAGSAAAAFDVGAASLLACVLFVWIFRRLARQIAGAPAASIAPEAVVQDRISAERAKG